MGLGSKGRTASFDIVVVWVFRGARVNAVETGLGGGRGIEAKLPHYPGAAVPASLLPLHRQVTRGPRAGGPHR